MDCPNIEILSQLEDGRFPSESDAGKHAASCRACRETLRWFRRIRTGLTSDPELAGREACPPAAVLGGVEEGRLSGGNAAGVAGHLDVCRQCTGDLTLLESRKGGTARRLFVPHRGFKTAIAAAALFTAGLAGWVAWTQSEEGHPAAPAAGIQLKAGTLYSSAAGEVLTSGEGMYIRLAKNTRLRCLSAKSGERIRLRLEQGEIAASISNRSQRLEILVPGGILKDVGTRFTAAVWETRPPWDPNNRVRITVVETSKGIVELSREAVRMESLPGRKGYLIENGDLFLREENGSGNDSLRKNLSALASALEQNNPQTTLQIWALLLDNAHRNRDFLREQLEAGSFNGVEREWIRRLLQETGGGE